jgi:dipeptidyl-peptidase-3
LTDSNGCVTVDYDAQSKSLIVRVDRLHLGRCTADVQSCREYYEELSWVHTEHLAWREIVLAKQEPRWVFVQANTFLRGEEVILKEYAATAKGVIQSWAERQV